MPSHRSRYPEQYDHPSVGKLAALPSDPDSFHRVIRVMQSRFGNLAELEDVFRDEGDGVDRFVAFELGTLILKG